MLREKADELRLGPFGIGKIKFGVELLLGAQEIARAQTGAPDQLLYLCTRGRRLQVFDDFRLDTAFAQQRKRISRGAAVGIVIDRDRLGTHIAYVSTILP